MSFWCLQTKGSSWHSCWNREEGSLLEMIAKQMKEEHRRGWHLWTLDIFYYAWISRGFWRSDGEPKASNFDWLFHFKCWITYVLQCYYCFLRILMLHSQAIVLLITTFHWLSDKWSQLLSVVNSKWDNFGSYVQISTQHKNHFQELLNCHANTREIWLSTSSITGAIR